MSRRGKARRPALGTVKLCSGSNVNKRRRALTLAGVCYVVLCQARAVMARHHASSPVM